MSPNSSRPSMTLRRLLTCSLCLAATSASLLSSPTGGRGQGEGSRRTPASADPLAIIQRAIQAHGGETLLRRLKAGRSKSDGIIAVADGIPFTQEAFFELPDRLKEIQVIE